MITRPLRNREVPQCGAILHAALGYAAIFLLAAVAIRWPALVSRWWRQDDFLVRTQSFTNPWTVTYYTGMARPGSFLYHALAQPAYRSAAWALVGRIAGLSYQAMTVAVLAAYLETIRVSRPYAALAGLLWITWPLASEGTIWLDGAVVSFAGLLSTLAVVVTATASSRWVSRAAAFGIPAAILTYPNGGMAGICILVTFLSWEVHARVADRRWPYRRAALVVAAYCVGFASAFLLARHYGTLVGARAVLSPGIESSLRYAQQFVWLVATFYERVPAWTCLALVVFPSVVAMAIEVIAVPEWSRIRAVLLGLVVLATNAMLPYLPSLAIAERWPSPRTAYVGPILLVGMAGHGILAARGAIGRLCVAAGIAAFVSLGTYESRLDAEGFVTVYRRDLDVLRSAERLAARHGILTLYSVTKAASFNPYEVEFAVLDHQRSEFTVDWQTAWFTRANSWLTFETRRAAQSRCEEIAAERSNHASVVLVAIPEWQCVCVVPPRP